MNERVCSSRVFFFIPTESDKHDTITQDFLGPEPPFFGPELHFARVLAEADPDNASLLVYKSWRSGMTIADELELPGNETGSEASVSLRSGCQRSCVLQD